MISERFHSHRTDDRRVVITGMGVVAPNGKDVKTFWESTRDGHSAAGPLTRFDHGGGPCRLACEITDFRASDYMEAKAANRLERSLQYGVAAATMAVADGRIDFKEIDPDRTGVVEATSLSNQDALDRARKAYEGRGHRAITPSMVISGYVGSGSAEIANVIGCKGHAITCSSSSASGNDVMGYAKSMIQNEDVDVMVAGGAEAPLFETGYAGFAHSRAMTRWQGPPEEAMKPFDRRSDGFVMGEGAAYVVLEELSHALSRGAHIYAELLGHGRSCEAYHAMAPHPDGAGLVRAMEKAFRSAGLLPTMVDYVNVHGTANAANDVAETRAIKTFFGAHARQLSISSTKPVTGHLLAAAGALETVICALAIENKVIPPTLNLHEPHPDCDLDYVPCQARPYPARVAVNLNSGFGGKTSCLVVGRYEP
jgi:3-oxoacyl-[acyl-carrier-protein] synthase II